MWIIGALVLWFVYKWISTGPTIPKDLTFTAYSLAHPECVQNGNVRCCHCGGRHIWLRLHTSGLKHRINAHVCKNCGNALYRSATPI